MGFISWDVCISVQYCNHARNQQSAFPYSRPGATRAISRGTPQGLKDSSGSQAAPRGQGSPRRSGGSQSATARVLVCSRIQIPDISVRTVSHMYEYEYEYRTVQCTNPGARGTSLEVGTVLYGK